MSKGVTITEEKACKGISIFSSMGNLFETETDNLSNLFLTGVSTPDLTIRTESLLCDIHYINYFLSS